MNLLSRGKIVKSVREEVIMIRVHETSHKESIYIKDVEDIKGCKTRVQYEQDIQLHI